MVDWRSTHEELAKILTSRLGLSAPEHWRVQRPKAIERFLAPDSEQQTMSLVSQLLNENLSAEPWQKLIAAATIGETRFLRERSWFEQIDRLALADIIKRRRREGRKVLNIWSAGCSSGEEAYTLALLLRERLPDFDNWAINILGTDVRLSAIDAAKRGIYETRQLRELNPHQIRMFFTPVDRSQFRVSALLRRGVRFQLGNLLSETVPPCDESGRFDLVVCRNVLIYMTPESQRRIAQNLGTMLKEDGWLVVSPTEATADWFKPLTPVNAARAILFVKRAIAKTKRPVHSGSVDPAPSIRTQHTRQDLATAYLLPRIVAAVAPRDATDEVADLRKMADRAQLGEARIRCQKILATDPLNTAATILLAEVCTELNEPSAAYEAARDAVYLIPTSPRAHFLLAGALSRLGEKRRASRALSIARSLADEESKRSSSESGA